MKNNQALIIIDMQKYLVTNELYKKDELVTNIGKLINNARNSDVPIIYVKHTIDDDEDMGVNTEGWQIYSKIKPQKDDIVILKYTPDAFYNTNLNDELKKRNIENIIIVGLQTEYCIDTTCRSAFRLGYNTILVEDGHSTYDNELLKANKIIKHHNMVLSEWFVDLKLTKDIVF